MGETKTSQSKRNPLDYLNIDYSLRREPLYPATLQQLKDFATNWGDEAYNDLLEYATSEEFIDFDNSEFFKNAQKKYAEKEVELGPRSWAIQALGYTATENPPSVEMKAPFVFHNDQVSTPSGPRNPDRRSRVAPAGPKGHGKAWYRGRGYLGFRRY